MTLNSNMKIVVLDTQKIIPYARNPRKNADAVTKVKASLQEFGWQQPIVVDKEMVVIVGHTRLEAAKELGYTEVPVFIADHLTDAQVKAYRIADNRVHQEAEWDIDLLKLEFADLKDVDFDLGKTGFDDDELNELLAEAIEEGLTDEDAVPEVPVEPKTKLGDIYILGNHRLMCGDSTSIDAVEKLMDGDKADMVFTDPPYGVSYTGGHNEKKRQGIIADTLQGDDLTDLFADSLLCATMVTKDHSAFYIWYANGKAVETFASFSKLPLKVRAVLCWYKVKSGLGAFMSQYIPNYEPCIYAYKDGCSPQWFGASNEKTVWELKKESVNEFHPTQKPIGLPERAMTNSSKSGDIVLDLFGGSGSTLIAAEKLGRKSRLMELDPKYCDVIVKRWEDFTGKKAELL